MSSRSTDAAALRAQAADLRQAAQYADGQQYYRDLDRARELDAQAAAAEKVEAERARRAAAKRHKQLAQIHLAAKELGIDDETYRDMLWTVARVRSAKDLDAAGRRAVIDHLVKLGHRPRKKGRTRVSRPRGELASKIQAQMAAQDLPGKYVDGIARRMFRVERWEWCPPEQLHKIVAALEYRERRARKQLLKTAKDAGVSLEEADAIALERFHVEGWGSCTPDQIHEIAKAIGDGASP